jgi:hypothetical protein
MTSTWFWQVFDIRITWLSALVGSIGGGNSMTASLAFVVLSDVTSEAERSAVFLRIGAFNLLANLVMPPFAAWLMEYTPWIPAIGGNVLQLLSALLFVFTPETLNYPHGKAGRPAFSRRNTASSIPPPPDPAPAAEPISLNTSSLWLKRLKNSTAFLTSDYRVPLCILPFTTHMMLAISGQLILQYMSTRYHLTFAEATLVATIRSAMVVVVLFVLLPAISKASMAYLHLSHSQKDLYLCRISQVFLALGWFVFGFANTVPFGAVCLVVASLGTGAPFLLRSFLTGLLPKDQIATAFSFISIVDTLGATLGAPLLAGMLRKGLKMGGNWMGMPFFFTALTAAFFAVVLCFVSVREDDDKGVAGAENEHDE